MPEELRTGRAAVLPLPAGEVVKKQGKRRLTAVYVSGAWGLGSGRLPLFEARNCCGAEAGEQYR
ncbi:hypothetical protein HMPREF3038_00731 [Akkermansia sp. KLE1797]|nr:hypothetical protein HMPREF3038_00731 [Akkermansia sp. KLE1797]